MIKVAMGLSLAMAVGASFLGCGSTQHAGAGGSTSGIGGTDSGPPTPSSCIPSENVEAIVDACGVFVSSSKGSDATGKGTMASPYQTLAMALAKANGKPVYACGEAFTVTQTVTLSATVDLYGALDCAQGWTYDATNKTQLQADTRMTPIPLTLASGASGSSVHDFAVTAADATMAGGSSIAMLDDQADLTLENVDVYAGAGAAGTMGVAQMQVTTPSTADGGNGTADPMCNVANWVGGGAGGTNACNGIVTNGGYGGKGFAASIGESGGDGQPMMAPGNGGAGQTQALPCSGSWPSGAAGAPGMAGAGARGIGDISVSGYQPPTSALGGAGSPGQGGGGGGGALACDTNEMFAGPSGGGGGAGGCGGAPGNLGQSGGSSIGILALGANLTLMNVTIDASAGGPGGNGGEGQDGGGGGSGGNAGGDGACVGEMGGQGGAGGPGGGGAGGHSVGIALNGGTLPDLSTTTVGSAGGGAGGLGGDLNPMAETKGDDGMACKTLDFDNPTTACAM